MKNLILIILFSTIINQTYSQKNSLNGSWILDFVTYADGKPLEVNHPSYSYFWEFYFSGDSLYINNEGDKVNIKEKSFTHKKITYNYEINEHVLKLSEKGKNYTSHFLKRETFLREYPEFRPQKTTYNDKDVYTTNEIIQPQLFHSKLFAKKIFDYFFIADSFENGVITKKFVFIPEYSGEFIDVSFVLKKNNKIIDLKIDNNMNKKALKLLQEEILNWENKLINPFGIDLLINYKVYPFSEVDFYQGFSKAIVDQKLQANNYYLQNKFEEAIPLYEKILNNDLFNEYKKPFYKNYLEAIEKELAICYLATNNIEKACYHFNNLGGKMNFNVRNYILNFCQE